jgi:hypothetical protein
MRRTPLPLRLAFLVVPIVLPLSPLALKAQDADAAADDAEWLADCRERDADHDEVRACEVLVETVPQAAGRIVVEASQNGAVEVRGWDRAEIEVHARIDAHAESMAEATRLARGVRLELAPGRIRALGVDDRRGGVSFEILVPRRAGLEVATHNGPLKVQGLQSEMRLSTENGPLALVDLGGDVNARATNGPLKVRLTGRAWSGAGLDAETVNGPVSLEIPDGYSADLEIGTYNGPFSSDMAITLEAGEVPNRMQVRLGQGGAPVRVVTTNGPYRIKRL